MLASKVNFASLTSDDKSDLATFCIFKSDSFSVNLTQFSAAVEPVFMQCSHGAFLNIGAWHALALFRIL